MDKAPPLPLGACARRLRVPPRWLREQADAGRIPHLRAGSQYLFDPATAERWLQEQLDAQARRASTSEVRP